MTTKKFKWLLLFGILLNCSLVYAQTGVQNYLSTSGNKLVDKTGKVVYLSGVNWFGFETSLFYPHGLWARDMKSVLRQIKDLGFNCIRIPWCSQMLDPGTTIKVSSFGSDPYTGVTPMNAEEATKTKSIELLDIIVDWCQANNLKIILDNHSKRADGFIAEGLWYTDGYDEKRWIDDWIFLANRYKGKSAVVGCDLKNEPHQSTWGNTNPATDFNKAAERCGNAILAANPELLIFVEGISKYNGDSYWWGGQLMGVRDFPVVLSKPNKLVYSPHEYGPELFPQTWFSDPTFPANMNGVWETHFGFIHSNNIAPLYIGEFGIRSRDNTAAVTWITKLMEFIGGRYNWTFWTINPNSGDTGGILGDDWSSINKWKMDILRPHLQSFIPNVVGGVVVTTYTITASAGANGSISPAGAVTVNEGASRSFTITPATGFRVDDVKVNGVSVGAVGTYTFNNVTSNQTITATFVANAITTYTITASAGANGSISPAGAVTVNAGTSRSFTITPAAGFRIDDVKVNGVSVGAVGTYTFNNVTSNQTIAATFVANTITTYTITASAGANGSITPTGAVTVNAGASRSFTITPATGFKIDDVKVNGVSVGDVGTYTFSNVTSNQTITATFVRIDTGGCNLLTAYQVPISTPLPSTMLTFSKAYVVGTGGPNLSNVTSAVINWDLPNKGLWQLSFNTNNGSPSWWIDFRASAQNLASPSPSITFRGTQIPNMDGQYYVTKTSTNVVFVAISGQYAIVFSNAATPPKPCSGGRISTVSTQKAFPNPVNGNWFIVETGVAGKNTIIELVNSTGMIVKTIQTNGNRLVTVNVEPTMASGLYQYRVKENSKVLYTGKITIMK
jgi:aryl-phospho-beta-D-glucosidase BglC (GH1 family)/ABC-type transporter MlaC component